MIYNNVKLVKNLLIFEASPKILNNGNNCFQLFNLVFGSGQLPELKFLPLCLQIQVSLLW
jgi:hypothetical protein